MSAADPSDFPGAVAPQRQYRIDAEGVGIAIHEWGDERDPVLMLAHGGLDFSQTYNVFAPLLAAAGWRVVAWDHRGHGDSDHPHLYSFDADLRDAVNVFDAVAGRQPVSVIGHSKSGAMMIALAAANPFRFSKLVNIDGMPWARPAPDVNEHERSDQLATDVKSWLDHRRSAAGRQRRPGTVEELAARRNAMNPRLCRDWMRYLVTVGAFEREDGWRWKLDPSLRFGGFGPWRPEWARHRLAGLAMPFLGLLVEHDEPMGWETKPEHIEPWLPAGGRIAVVEGSGHFAHIEQPDVVASLVLDFLGTPA